MARAMTLLPAVILACVLGGCVVAPLGPPGRVYVAPRVVVVSPPVIVARPWYYRHW